MKGHVRNFSEYVTDLETVMEQVVLPDCPPPIYALAHSMGGAVALKACHDGSRWFDRVVLSSPMIALAAGRMGRAAGPLRASMRYIGRGSGYIPTRPRRFRRRRRFRRQRAHLRSGALRAQHGGAGGSARARHRRADHRLGGRRAAADEAVHGAGFAGTLRQPILMVAAGRDEVVSTPAIETFGMNLLAGSHLILAGARHEILQEQDHLPRPVLGGLRRLRARHAAVLALRQDIARREPAFTGARRGDCVSIFDASPVFLGRQARRLGRVLLK